MFRKRKFLFIVFVCICLIFSFMISQALFRPIATEAQYWTLMPPYNVLWPLYSTPLSPIDPVTGLPTPIVSELTANTILPVQPGIAWDPCQPTPWLLYNRPPSFGGGLLWFDWQYGLNPWPPSYLKDPITGAPAPITWLGTWTTLEPWDAHHFEFYIPLANATYALAYGLFGQPYLDLLTAAQLFGLPPILPF